jgi:hypothetical protein
LQTRVCETRLKLTKLSEILYHNPFLKENFTKGSACCAVIQPNRRILHRSVSDPTAAGERATRRLTELVRGQQLTCQLEGRRSWDREVGVCALPGGRDLGEILIAERLCTRWR